MMGLNHSKIFEAVSIATQLIVNSAWFWNTEMHVIESLPPSWSEVVTSVTNSAGQQFWTEGGGPLTLEIYLYL